MFNALFRLVIPTVAFCTISGAALAEVSTCTFEKITSKGFHTDNKKKTLSALGEAVAWARAEHLAQLFVVLVSLVAVWVASELVAVVAQAVVWFRVVVAKEVVQASLHLFSDQVCFLLVVIVSEANVSLGQEVASFPKRMWHLVFALVRFLFVLSSQPVLACCGAQVRPSAAL